MYKSIRKKRDFSPYLLIVPAFMLMLVVVAYPIINSIIMSFQQNILFKPNDIKFIGFDNYINILKDETFWKALTNTLIWIVFGVGFQFLFGFICALIIKERFIGRGLARSIILIPWVTPGILIALIWKLLYDGNGGVINDLLLKLGVVQEAIPWLASSRTSLFAVTVTIIWQGIPFFAIMILAALQGISEEYYEAASVDGASALQKLFHITIPSIAPTIVTTALLRIIWVANSVDVIYGMTAGGPGFSSMTLSVATFIKAQKALDFGYSSAMSLYLTLLLLIVAIPYLKKNLQQRG